MVSAGGWEQLVAGRYWSADVPRDGRFFAPSQVQAAGKGSELGNPWVGGQRSKGWAGWGIPWVKKKKHRKSMSITFYANCSCIWIFLSDWHFDLFMHETVSHTCYWKSLPTPHLSDLVNDYSMPTTAVNRILHMDLAAGTCPLHAAQ